MSYGVVDSGRSSDFSGLSAGVRQAAAAATATFWRRSDSLSGSESAGNTETDNDTDASVRGSPFLHATCNEMAFLGDDCFRASFYKTVGLKKKMKAVCSRPIAKCKQHTARRKRGE